MQWKHLSGLKNIYIGVDDTKNIYYGQGFLIGTS